MVGLAVRSMWIRFASCCAGSRGRGFCCVRRASLGKRKTQSEWQTGRPEEAEKRQGELPRDFLKVEWGMQGVAFQVSLGEVESDEPNREILPQSLHHAQGKRDSKECLGQISNHV